MMPAPLKVIIAGGGTGGHLFPGVAVADEFRRRDPGTEILFVGTRRGLESRVLGRVGYALRTIPVSGLRGKGAFGILGGLMKIPAALMASRDVLEEFEPHLVFGVGGYASGPVVLAARLMGIPTAVAEQNAVPGLTNRILGRVARRVFVSFPETLSFFAAGKAVVTGNPVRRGFIEAPSETPARHSRFTVLVVGGSQGAGAVNEAFVEAASRLRDLEGGLYLIHQTGPGGDQVVREAYERVHVAAEVHPFIEDMAAAYDRADLLVCRAGATTVAEITARGKAAVFVPFPHAAGDHQRKNAELLVRGGAGEMILQKDLTGETLAGMIERLSRDRDRVADMAGNARKLGNVNAARDIVASCLELIEEKNSVLKG